MKLPLCVLNHTVGVSVFLPACMLPTDNKHVSLEKRRFSWGPLAGPPIVCMSVNILGLDQPKGIQTGFETSWTTCWCHSSKQSLHCISVSGSLSYRLINSSLVFVNVVPFKSFFWGGGSSLEPMLRLLVPSQVHLPLEALATEVASEWFESRVLPAVRDEIWTLAECLPTHLAFMRLFTCKNTLWKVMTNPHIFFHNS